MLKGIFLAASVCISVSGYCQEWHLDCGRNEDGLAINCVRVPGKDPALTITEEDMKGMVYVSPEQKRKMDEKIFREKLQAEITIRKSQDFRLDDAGALAEILAGKPRRF